MAKTTVRELVEHLDQQAPYVLQESYDNSRLIVGSSLSAIDSVLCCLDSTEEIVDEAIERGCNVIVAHHPIIFSGIKSLTGSSYIERTILKAIKNDISIISYHTNLDSIHPEGVNSRLAEILELENCEVLLQKKNDLPIETGMGLLGNLRRAMTWPEFLEHVKVKLKLEVYKYTRPIGETVKKVALCGGSGSFLLEEAKKTGAEVFLSSDYKYHQFFDAENQITILDIGHYESEKHTPKLINDIITNKFSNFAVLLSRVNTNPINYYF